METEQSKYIRLLRQLREDMKKEDGGTNFDEFKAIVKQYKIHQHPEMLYRKIFDNPGPAAGKDKKYHMGLDAFFMLLDYEELAHSLEESKKARAEARTATWFAAGAMSIQVLLFFVEKYWLK